MRRKRNERLSLVFDLLDINAYTLDRDSGVDHTLISKWLKGTRPITRRSKQLLHVVDTLLRLDTEGRLAALIEPYRQNGETAAEALREYLIGEDMAGFVPTTRPHERQTTGDYPVQYHVFLGHKGFQQAALMMLDYIQTLPPGREVMALCQGRYEWLTGDLPFALQFIAKLQKSVKRGTRLLVINRRGYSIAETAAFAGPWLLAHLHGTIRSRYYDGELPRDLRFAVSIPGYWSAHVEEDAVVEDATYSAVYTDPKDIRRDEELCCEFLARSRNTSQYGFLQNTMGVEEDAPLWRDGPLPAWPGGYRPDGSIATICRVPAFGIMTQEEFVRLLGNTPMPRMPSYLLQETEQFSRGAHHVILCREDVRDALAGSPTPHAALSMLLHQDVFVPREVTAAQIVRLLTAMEKREEFEVALVPRVAFEKLQMEIVCWKDSASVGWLQDMSESVFADDEATSGSFHGAVLYVWDKLLASWKRRENVTRQLRKWLAGQGLDMQDKDSALVKNWDVMPR